MLRRKFNKNDAEILAVSNLFNSFALFICWIAIALAIIYFLATSKLSLSIVFLMVIPFRYFFFDISPSKLSKRPAALDRIIPVTIFISYLSRSFSIPNGNFLASCWGFVLALGRITINGFGLLYFDTFAFLFKIQEQRENIPLNHDIKALHSNQRIEEIQEKLEQQSIQDPQQKKFAEKLRLAQKQITINHQLTEWDFEIRRYVDAPTMYFKNAEVGNAIIDDKYALDLEAYNRDHPENPIIIPVQKQQIIEQQKSISNR